MLSVVFDLYSTMCFQTSNRPYRSLPFSLFQFAVWPFVWLRGVSGCHLNIVCYFKNPPPPSPAGQKRGFGLEGFCTCRRNMFLVQRSGSHTNFTSINAHSTAISTPLRPFHSCCSEPGGPASGRPARLVCRINSWYVGD